MGDSQSDVCLMLFMHEHSEAGPGRTAQQVVEGGLSCHEMLLQLPLVCSLAACFTWHDGG